MWLQAHTIPHNSSPLYKGLMPPPNPHLGCPSRSLRAPPRCRPPRCACTRPRRTLPAPQTAPCAGPASAGTAAGCLARRTRPPGAPEGPKDRPYAALLGRSSGGYGRHGTQWCESVCSPAAISPLTARRRQRGHAKANLGELQPTLGVLLPHALHRGAVPLERAVESLGDGVVRHVVVRAPDAARGEDKATRTHAMPEVADRVDDVGHLIRHERDTREVDALGMERFGQPGRVGVRHLAPEQLIPNHQEGCLRGTSR